MWTFAGKGGQAIASIIVLIALARLLSPEDFGVMSAALIFIGFSQIFSQLGVGPAIVQKKDLHSEDIRTGFLLSFCTGCIAFAAIWLLAPAIAGYLSMPALHDVLRVFSIAFPIASISMISESLLQRNMWFKELSMIEFGSYLIGYAGVGVALAWLGFGVWALVYGQLAQIVLKTLLMLSYIRKDFGFGMQWSSAKSLINFGAGFSIAKIGNFVATQADNFVVARWMGAEALGFYGRAYQFLMMPTNLIGKVIDRALFPAMARVQDDNSRLTTAFLRSNSLTAMLVMPLSAVLIASAPYLVVFLLGERWAPVILPFQFLAVILVFRIAYKFSDSLARAKGAVYRRAARQWIYAAAVFIGAWTGSFYGIAGVAAGVAAAVFLNYTLMLHLTGRLIGIKMRAVFACYLPYLVIALVMFAILQGVVQLLAPFIASGFVMLLIIGLVWLLLVLLVVWWQPKALADDIEWLRKNLLSKFDKFLKKKGSV